MSSKQQSYFVGSTKLRIIKGSKIDSGDYVVGVLIKQFGKRELITYPEAFFVVNKCGKEKVSISLHTCLTKTRLCIAGFVGTSDYAVVKSFLDDV